MKERPILFSAPMARSILDGRKTQTRRVCKPAVDAALSCVVGPFECPELDSWNFGDEDGDIQFRCPYGQPGDRLWVRETWQGPLFNEDQLEAYQSNGSTFKTPEYCKYAADGGEPPEFFDADGNLQRRWRPSIHMPRWASRITLEITDVRVERLNEISLEDVIAEGISELVVCLDGTDSYKELWESINGPGSWDANPWVWIVEFERIKA